MRKLSVKRAKQNREYLKLKDIFLTENPVCQAKINRHCTNEATQIHHQRGRVGALLTDTNNFLAVCYQCHAHIELNPILAKELGFSKSRLAND